MRCFEAVPSLKCSIALAIADATGLPLSEVVAVEIGDIDRGRKGIRVEHGKGAKDRYDMLARPFLGILRGMGAGVAAAAPVPRTR